MPTRREVIDRIGRALAPLYEANEAMQIARTVLFDRCGLTLTDYALHPDAEAEIPDLDQLVGQLAAGRPVQYVLGRTEFCGGCFEVREGVLIPRPETEELVAAVAAEAPAGSRLLDVGTGSGCIAVSLARLRPDLHATAVDLSEQALASFSRGDDCSSYEFLGAHPMTLSGQAGIRFAVWAPGVKSVRVISEADGWQPGQR